MTGTSVIKGLNSCEYCDWEILLTKGSKKFLLCYCEEFEKGGLAENKLFRPLTNGVKKEC